MPRVDLRHGELARRSEFDTDDTETLAKAQMHQLISRHISGDVKLIRQVVGYAEIHVKY